MGRTWRARDSIAEWARRSGRRDLASEDGDLLAKDQQPDFLRSSDRIARTMSLNDATNGEEDKAQTFPRALLRLVVGNVAACTWSCSGSESSFRTASARSAVCPTFFGPPTFPQARNGVRFLAYIQTISQMTVALRQVGRSTVHIDHDRVTVEAAVRATIGVVLPLIVLGIAGHPQIGAAASVGALLAGFASFQGIYRSRAGVVVVTCLTMSVVVFVGATVGHVLGIDMLVVGLSGFVAGLLVCLGQSAATVGTQSVVLLVIYSQFTLTPVAALRAAGIVFAGGMVQTLLIIVVWPFHHYPAERRALGDVYTQLAENARRIASDTTDFVAPRALAGLATILTDPQPFGGTAEMAAHNALATQAERIQLELTALARAKQRLNDSGARDAAAALNEMSAVSAAALDEVSSSLREAHSPMGLPDQRDRFESALKLIKPAPNDRSIQSDGGWWAHAARQEAYDRAQALAGQLRTAIRVAAVLAGGDPAALEKAAVTGQAANPSRSRDLNRAREHLNTLRANLTLSSQACRHAVRLAVALTLAVGVADLIDLPHRYWLPLTVMIVLKPDFSSTFARGVSRIAGTLIGAGVVTIAIAELRPGEAGLTVLVTIFAFGAYSVLFANYAMYSVCLASLVVTLLAITGAPAPSVAGDRVVYTTVGAALALVAYAVWPTWERTALPERLARLIDVDGTYGQAVLKVWIDPAGADRQHLQEKHLAARLARSNAEAAVARWMAEPVRDNTFSPDTVVGLLASAVTYARGVVTLHARLPESRPPLPELTPLVEGLNQAMNVVAATLRSGEPAGRLPRLRSRQLQLAHHLGFFEGADRNAPNDIAILGVSNQSQDGDEGKAKRDAKASLVLVSETDLIVNSVNTLGHLVGLEPEA